MWLKLKRRCNSSLSVPNSYSYPEARCFEIYADNHCFEIEMIRQPELFNALVQANSNTPSDSEFAVDKEGLNLFICLTDLENLYTGNTVRFFWGKTTPTSPKSAESSPTDYSKLPDYGVF